MFARNLVVPKVYFVFILFLGSILSQEAEVTTESPAVWTDSPEVASDVICQICNCTIPEVVNCSSRELKYFFELQDWDGLQPFNPVTVDLSQNHLTTVTRISSLPIQHLNISNCDIETLEDASFVYLADLVTLDLSRNRISSSALNRRVFVGTITLVPGLLPSSKLRYLSLAYNDIHSLPQDIFASMPGLTTLNLSGNPLALIDQVTMAAITDLVNLRELYLNGCELENLPDGLFCRQRRLQILDLSDNRFTTVPSMLSEARNLLYLNFGKNPIQVLNTTNAIRNLTKLQELRLCRNSKLQTIEVNALGGLSNLVSLHICYNPRLTSIDPDFLTFTDEHDVETWPTLTEFYLNNNNISKLDSSFLHRWDQLVRMDFSNNPYECDCRNQWVVQVLTPRLIKREDETRNNMICKRPLEVRGVSFSQIYKANKTLTCPESEELMDIPVPNLAILLGIMIGIFVTFPLVLVVVILWRKGFFARCRSSKEEEYDEETDAF